MNTDLGLAGLGLVFKAHRLLDHSTLVSRVIKKMNTDLGLAGLRDHQPAQKDQMVDFQISD